VPHRGHHPTEPGRCVVAGCVSVSEVALAPESPAGSGAGATVDDRTTAEIVARAGREDFWRFAEQRPSCSFEYAGDVWHLIVAGITGGHKGVSPGVVDHPKVFASVTAPGFAAVHTTPNDKTAVAPAAGPAGRRPCARTAGPRGA